MNTSERIKKAREKQGLSQYKLAERIEGLTQSQIAKIEIGIRRVTVADLFAIAKALNLSVNYFIDDFEKTRDGDSARPRERSFTITLQFPQNVEILGRVQAVSEHEAVGKVFEHIPTATYENIIEIKEDI